MSRGTLDHTRYCFVSTTWLLHFIAELSNSLRLRYLFVDDVSATPAKKTSLVWAIPRSLAATYGIEFLSFPPGT